jgi:hypothetical protein
MPKVTAKVLATKVEQGKLMAILRFSEKLPPKEKLVTVEWGAKRSLMQNAFYWEYLTFLIEVCGLKENYLTIKELHETLKATFLSKRMFTKSGLEIIKVGTTTQLDKTSFAEYLEKIDKAMVEYHHVDTSQFWKDYNENYKL